MSQSPRSVSSLPTLRRNLHLQLQLLILPVIIVALVLMLVLPGCSASGEAAVASAGKCSPEEKANCICRQPGVISFAVEGMACPNCAKELQAVLAAVPGVKSAKVCFEDSKAFVTLDKEHPATLATISAAVAAQQGDHVKLEQDVNRTRSKQ
jgi:copper chaperone CopZ